AARRLPRAPPALPRHRHLYPLAPDRGAGWNLHRRGVRARPEDPPRAGVRRGGRPALFPPLARAIDRRPAAGGRARAGDGMTTEARLDVSLLRDEIRRTYNAVSIEPEREFIFPTGRAWAQELAYPEPELGRVPDATVESFAGVANHWLLGRAEPGAVVLDLGCGAGTDLLIAAQMAGPAGRAI